LLSDESGYNLRKVKIYLSHLVAFGLIQKVTQKHTSYGEVVSNYDKYLENHGTLWTIHYNLSSNAQLVIWNRLFNGVITGISHDIDYLLINFYDLKGGMAEYTFNRNVKKEIKMTLDTYTDERFSKLELIEKYEGKYKGIKNNKVPNLILLAACITFKDKYYPGATAVDVKELCHANNSPGKVFFLDEDVVRKQLEELKNEGLIGIESRADLDQIRISSDLTVEAVLENYYKTL
jgi:hypothetical protein